MAKCKVWNRHPSGITHKEMFKGSEVIIPAGEHILMDYEEAVQFRGQYYPMKKNAQGADDPASFKVIHIEPLGAAPEVTKFICPITKKEFFSQKDFDAHLQQYRDLVHRDEVLDKEIADEQAVKRGPGRPPKEKTA